MLSQNNYTVVMYDGLNIQTPVLGTFGDSVSMLRRGCCIIRCVLLNPVQALHGGVSYFTSVSLSVCLCVL